MPCNYRLVEIAANRFPAKFGTETAQADLCSQVHVFTDITCSSLLARYTVNIGNAKFLLYTVLVYA